MALFFKCSDNSIVSCTVIAGHNEKTSSRASAQSKWDSNRNFKTYFKFDDVDLMEMTKILMPKWQNYDANEEIFKKKKEKKKETYGRLQRVNDFIDSEAQKGAVLLKTNQKQKKRL